MELEQINQEDISEYYVCDTCNKLFLSKDLVNLWLNLSFVGRCKVCGLQEKEAEIVREQELQNQKKIERYNNISKYIEENKKKLS